jgi:hypothetical protein
VRRLHLVLSILVLKCSYVQTTNVEIKGVLS